MTSTNDKVDQQQERPMLVVYPRGQVSELDKARMEQFGILAVEADNPKDVFQIEHTVHYTQSVITGDAIVKAALHALANGGSTTANRLFIEKLNEGVKHD